MEDEISLIDFLRVLVRKRGLIIGGTAIITIFSIFYSLWLPRGYESRVRVLVLKQKFTIKSSSNLITEEPDVSVNTQLELMGSREIARRVVKGLGLDKGEYPMTADSLLASASLEIVKTTPVIELTVSAGNPELSRDIANRWANEFVKYNEEVYSNENKDFSVRLKRNFEDVKNRIEIQKKKISKFLSSNRKIPYEIIAGKEDTIIALQQKAASLSESLDMFTSNYRDSWQLVLDDVLGSVRKQVALLKRRKAENEDTLEALRTSFSLVSSKKISMPVEVKIPFSEKKERDSSAPGKKVSRFFLASSTDPVAVKLKLDILNVSIENREALVKIEYLEQSLPEVEKIFSDIRGLDITAMSSDEIVKISGSLREKLTPYSPIPGGLDIDDIYEDMSNYISTKKSLDNVRFALNRYLREYNDVVLKSKSYELGFTTLEKDYTTFADTYIALGQKIEEYSLKEGVSTGNVKLIEAAIIPKGPSTPVKRKIVALTFIFSLLFFVFIGFLMDYYQREGGEINESAT